MENNEKERLQKIKESLDDSYYSKIFDIAIENVKLQEKLNKNQTLVESKKYTWHDSPNIALGIKCLFLIFIILTLSLEVKYNIDNIYSNEEKQTQKDGK